MEEESQVAETPGDNSEHWQTCEWGLSGLLISLTPASVQPAESARVKYADELFSQLTELGEVTSYRSFSF